jgi:hypothetical protein
MRIAELLVQTTRLVFQLCQSPVHWSAARPIYTCRFRRGEECVDLLNHILCLLSLCSIFPLLNALRNQLFKTLYTPFVLGKEYQFFLVSGGDFVEALPGSRELLVE